MYKLVALDLDGTLLDDNQKISRENIETIRHLKDLGVKFVIVTGRSDSMTAEIVDALNINAPILGNNGATIRDPNTKELIYLSEIHIDSVAKVSRYLLKNNIYFRWYGLDEVYSFNKNEFDEMTNPYAKFSKRLASFMKFHVLEDLEELLKLNPTILRCMCVTEDEDNLTKINRELKTLVDDEIFKSSAISLDIVAKGSSKGNALLEYGKMIGVSSNEMVAIGDNGNDISMLSVVGMPVTLENGDVEVKKIVKLVAKSNNESGVSNALQTIFNSKFSKSI